MIMRIIKSVWNILLFYVLAYAVATTATNAISVIANNDRFMIEYTRMYSQLEPEVLDFILKYFFFNERIRFFFFLGIMVFLYSSIMAKHQRTITRQKVHDVVYRKPKRYINKVMEFRKPGWFWFLCLITNFMPILIPLAIWIIARIVLGLFAFIVSPILYPVSHVLLAINGTVK